MPSDSNWLRKQAGTTPRALDRDFVAASPASIAAAEIMAKAAVAGTKSKMYNRRTWTKEENQQLQDGIASFGGPNADLGKNVSFLVWFSRAQQ